MEIKNDNVSALDANGNVIKDIDVNCRGNHHGKQRRQDRKFRALNVNLNGNSGKRAISKLDGLKLKITKLCPDKYRYSVAKHTMDAAKT